MAKTHIPFRIKKSKDGQYYSVIVAKNGQVTHTSETYTRKGNAIKAAIKESFEIYLTWKNRTNLYIDETK